MSSPDEPESDRSASQFRLRRLFEFPVVFAVFFYFGESLGVEISLALAAITLAVVGLRSQGSASLYSCLLHLVILAGLVSGALRAVARS
jgi:hypothetical protein